MRALIAPHSFDSCILKKRKKEIKKNRRFFVILSVMRPLIAPHSFDSCILKKRKKEIKNVLFHNLSLVMCLLIAPNSYNYFQKKKKSACPLIIAPPSFDCYIMKINLISRSLKID